MSAAPAIDPYTTDDPFTFGPLELGPLLDAALAAFNEQGFHGASVRDIAGRVGVTVPTLYYHHGSKQGVLLALLHRSMTELTARADGALAVAGDDPVSRVGHLVDVTARYMCHRQRLAWLDAQMRYLDDDARSVYAAPRKRFEVLVLGEVERGAAAGRFRIDEPIDTTRALLGMLQSVATWYRPEGPLDPAEIGARHVGFVLDLLRTDRRQRDAAVRDARRRRGGRRP